MRVYRLKRKNRFIVFLFILFAVTALIIGSVSSNGKNAKREYRTITVRQGDTLWGIADKYRGKTEIREYIYQIKKLNNLDNATIYAGQKLSLP